MAEVDSLLLDDGQESDKPRLTAAQIARETNLVIYDLAERLAVSRRDTCPVGFLCECGCFRITTATLFEYEAAGGTWIDGHQPG